MTIILSFSKIFHKIKFELGSPGIAGGFVFSQIFLQQNTPERFIFPAGEIEGGVIFFAGLQDEFIARKSGYNSVCGTIGQLENYLFSTGTHKFCRAVSSFALMLNANAKKASIIATFFVQIILPFSYETQIASPVVERVPVSMVNNLTLLCVHYEAGERDRSFV
jgi:hypothetical protein